jgi:hypothetical protein
MRMCEGIWELLLRVPRPTQDTKLRNSDHRSKVRKLNTDCYSFIYAAFLIDLWDRSQGRKIFRFNLNSHASWQPKNEKPTTRPTFRVLDSFGPGEPETVLRSRPAYSLPLHAITVVILPRIYSTVVICFRSIILTLTRPFLTLPIRSRSRSAAADPCHSANKGSAISEYLL